MQGHPEVIDCLKALLRGELAARDQYLNHVMTCRACYAPTGRHCPTGAELRATRDGTPMELTP